MILHIYYKELITSRKTNNKNYAAYIHREHISRTILKKPPERLNATSTTKVLKHLTRSFLGSINFGIDVPCN